MKIPDKWKLPLAGFDPWRNPGDAKFDLSTARRIVRFFPEHLVHMRGEWAGRPFSLEPWQEQLMGHAFAWKRPDGTRRFRIIFLYLPRKNGKSQIAAGLIILLLFFDGEPAAEGYCTAADIDMAKIVYNESSNMIANDATIAGSAKFYKSLRTIEVPSTKSILRVLSSDAKLKHGLMPHFFIIDEYHLQRTTEMYENFETGTGARRQSLGVLISTADYFGDSPCNSMLDYARKVRDGIIDDPTFFPVIFESVDGVDDWQSEETWKKVNPNWGVSVKPDWMRRQYLKAKESKADEFAFKRLNLNMQTNVQNCWLDMAQWELCMKNQVNLDGRPLALGGLDLSSTGDITALVLYFPERKALKAWFWVPKKTAQSRREYQIWAEQGWIEITDGTAIDYDRIRRRVSGYYVEDGEVKSDPECIAKTYDLRQLGYDPYNAPQVVRNLAEEDGLPMVEFRQGFLSMNMASKQLETMVRTAELCPGENPVLRWMASNAEIKSDASGNIKPVKPFVSSQKKIDGIVASVMGVGLSLVYEPPKPSIYESRGVRSL